MNVHVDADQGLMAGNAQHQIGAFGTNPPERAHQLGVTGQRAIVHGGKMARNIVDLFGLGVVWFAYPRFHLAFNDVIGKKILQKNQKRLRRLHE